jgi:hypothetical protein
MSDKIDDGKLLFSVTPVGLGLAALFSNEAIFSNEARQAVIDAASISKGLAAIAQSEISTASIAAGLAQMARDAVAGMESLGQVMRSLMGEQGYENMLMSRAIAGRYLHSIVEPKDMPQFMDSPDKVM